MYRWLQRLFSGPAAVPGSTPAATPAPAAGSTPSSAASGNPGAQGAAGIEPVRAPARAAAALDRTPAAPAVAFDQMESINAAWNAWLFERTGTDEGGLEMNEQETRVLESLASILSSQQSGAALVRRMPGLVPQLLQSLRSDSFSGSALSRTISSDVVLVAAVIRLANGAYAGTGNAITSVEHAVILIGQEGLRQLITTVAFRPIIDIHSGYYVRRLAPRLWEHSERCAMSARQLAADLRIEPFDAFLAALLQNVGLIVALRVMDQASNGEPTLGSEMFLAQLARAARLLSASIAREWNFPEAVVQALAEQGGMRRGASISPLGRLLQLTDYLGKLRMLVEQDLLNESDPDLFAGLPPNAPSCYALLAASREQAPQE